MIKLLKNNYFFLLFLIPLFPHVSLNINRIHLDDIPIILYLFLFGIFSNKKEVIKNAKSLYPLLVFILFLSLQNIFLYNDSLNTEIF